MHYQKEPQQQQQQQCCQIHDDSLFSFQITSPSNHQHDGQRQEKKQQHFHHDKQRCSFRQRTSLSHITILLLLLFISGCTILVIATTTSKGPSSSTVENNDNSSPQNDTCPTKDNPNAPTSNQTITAQESIIQEINSFLSSPSSSTPLPSNLNNQKYTFTTSAYNFFQSIAQSTVFKEIFWRRQPLLFPTSSCTTTSTTSRSSSSENDDKCIQQKWAKNIFTLKDLKMIDGSFISGQQTSEAIRSGKDEKRWNNNKNIKDDPNRRTRWSDVVSALSDGTVFFNHASLSFPSLAHLCRLATSAFGFPTNVNIYVTPPKVKTSIPPHTDRQDVLILQSTGSKRWRVWGPPVKQSKSGAVDPFNRGKNGDIITERELQSGKLLIDTVLMPGDVLYVPAGFPHTTDTLTVVDAASDNNKKSNDNIFTETSLHLTLGLDAHVWGLTLMHLRQFVLRRSRKDPALRHHGGVGGVVVMDEEASWDVTGPIPIGFLADGGEKNYGWDQIKKQLCQKGRFTKNIAQFREVEDNYLDGFIEEMKQIMMRLEPTRFTDSINDEQDDLTNVDTSNNKESSAAYESVSPNVIQRQKPREALPSREQMLSVIEYVVCRHLAYVLRAQEAMYSSVTDPRDDGMLLEMRELSKKQNEIMRRLNDFGQQQRYTYKERGLV